MPDAVGKATIVPPRIASAPFPVARELLRPAGTESRGRRSVDRPQDDGVASVRLAFRRYREERTTPVCRERDDAGFSSHDRLRGRGSPARLASAWARTSTNAASTLRSTATSCSSRVPGAVEQRAQLSLPVDRVEARRVTLTRCTEPDLLAVGRPGEIPPVGPAGRPDLARAKHSCGSAMFSASRRQRRVRSRQFRVLRATIRQLQPKSMTLAPGMRLGPYEIVAPLGAGGMGEVYRAHDTRLGRDVAVKVLPQHLARTPRCARASSARRRRSRRSTTRTSARCFDVGREGDTDYLVMELVEGETLAAAAGEGRAAGRPRCCGSARRSPTRWTARTARASSTATSSPATSC